MGDRTIQQVPFRFFAVFAAPLILAGCGAPVAFQVASLFADGISLVTTDKTLTDHGLSAVAGKDCAVWRIIQGKEICVGEAEGSPILVEAGTSQQPSAMEEDEDNMFFSDGEITAGKETKITVSQETKNDLPRTAWKNPDEQPVKTPPPSPVVTSTPLPPLGATNLAAAEPTPEPEIPVPAKIKGGTFYIIASFRGIAAAHRFSKKHWRWQASVLEGTASGRTVFRVAIGPVGKLDYGDTRNRLIENGFKDAWAIKISTPKVTLELAELN